jgi:hypothetical protein
MKWPQMTVAFTGAAFMGHWPWKGVFVMGLILLVVIVLLLVGAVPTWPHSRNWGYGPSGGLGLVLLVVLVLVLLGYLPRTF